MSSKDKEFVMSLFVSGINYHAVCNNSIDIWWLNLLFLALNTSFAIYFIIKAIRLI